MFKIVSHEVVLVESFPDNMTDAKALELSIRKWQFIVDNFPAAYWDSGDDTCALCHLYLFNAKCVGCPVQYATKESSCYCTPYDEWREVPSLESAQNELKFLKSLQESE